MLGDQSLSMSALWVSYDHTDGIIRLPMEGSAAQCGINPHRMSLHSSAINMAWEHGGADFQSRFDKTTGQAQEMKEGALRVL